MSFVPWLLLVFAAVVEVGGDAVIRRGLRGRGMVWVLTGCVALALYGMVVNSVKWDFSRLLGVYVGFFAAASVLFGRFVFQEEIPVSTWLGLAMIIVGGLVMQFGHR
jgi:small multidrug resistance family-3 protein